VVVLILDQERVGDYFAVAGELRAAGIAAEVYLGTSGMRPQMKYADRRLSPAAVIIGGDEFAAGTVTIKDLDLGRELASGVADNAAWRAERPGTVHRAARRVGLRHPEDRGRPVVRVEPPVPAQALAAIRAALATAGAEPVDAPMLQPLNLLLDLAGEAMRARLFVVQAGGGVEECLRPDFTVAVGPPAH
jgi:histidyl-tRNA synthetase